MMKGQISVAALMAALRQIEQVPDVPDARAKGSAAEPLRRYSVMRDKLIYVCPACFRRVRQFRDSCHSCGKRLLWDIRVVKS